MKKDKNVERFIQHAYSPVKFDKPTKFYKYEISSNTCDDRITLYIYYERTIVASYNVEGCRTCLASTSLLVEFINGKTINEIEGKLEQHILNNFGENIVNNKKNCCYLIIDLINNWIKDVKNGSVKNL